MSAARGRHARQRGRHRAPRRTPQPRAGAAPPVLTVALTGTLAVASVVTPLLPTEAAEATEAAATPAPSRATAQPIPVPPVPDSLPTVIEALPEYVPQTRCARGPQPGVRAFARLLLRAYPSTGSDGVLRDCGFGGVSEHKEGRAFDWDVHADNPKDQAYAEALLSWLLAPDEAGHPAAMARRLGIMYIIWDHRIYGLYRSDEGWRPYFGVNPHTEHMHFSFTWAGALKRTSYWTGEVAEPVPNPLPPPPEPLVREPGAPEPGEPGPGEPEPAAPDGPAAEPEESDSVAAQPDEPPGSKEQPAAAEGDTLADYRGTVLRLGSSGAAVAALQDRIGVVADGQFGPITRGAVVAFQTAHGLVVDGVVGPHTWSALLVEKPTDEAAKPTEPPAPAEPSEPAEPTEPAEPSEAAEPSEPTPPSAATDATAPAPPRSRPTPPSGLDEVDLSPYTGTLLRQGARGPAVAALQTRLGITADGIFGPVTRSAVVAFQAGHGLVVDGVVGPHTWAALSSTP